MADTSDREACREVAFQVVRRDNDAIAGVLHAQVALDVAALEREHQTGDVETGAELGEEPVVRRQRHHAGAVAPCFGAGFDVPVNPAALLLEQAPDALFAPILTRLDDAATAAVLGGHRAPGPRLTAHVLDCGDVRERTVMAGNLGLRAEDFVALAETAGPEVASRLLVNRQAPREAQLRVLPVAPAFAVLAEAAAHDSDASHALQTCIAVCVDTPDPLLVRAALARLDVSTNALAHHAVIMRGCLTLLDAEDREAIPDVLARIQTTSLRREVDPPSAPVEAALAEPTRRELVAEALAHESGMGMLLRRLRRENTHRSFEAFIRDPDRNHDGTFGLLLASPRAPLDWEAILREHRRAPFGRYARKALARQLGCPPELAKAEADRPGSSERTPIQRLRGVVARRRLFGLMEHSMNGHPHHELVNAYAKGLLPARHVLHHAHGAQAGLVILAGASGAGLAEAQRELAAVTRDTLGADADAWVVALTLLPEFTGTPAELLRTAAATTA